MKELVEEYGFTFLAISTGMILISVCVHFFVKGGFFPAIVESYFNSIC